MTTLLTILILIQLGARLATWPASRQIWLAGLAVGLSTWLLLPYAWENSLVVIEQKLQTGLWADNFTLIVSLDVMLASYIGYKAFSSDYQQNTKHRWIQLVPPILLLPAVFWVSANFFYHFPGQSYAFSGIAIMTSLAVGLPFIAMLLRWALVKRTTIVEFSVAVALLIFTVMLLQPLVGAPPPTHREPVAWTFLAILAGICVTGFVIGYALFKIIKKLKLKL